MNLNSPLFQIASAVGRPQARPKPARARRAAALRPSGLQARGEFRAPKGRDREGQYFRFCLDHVREYNASYNYFPA